MLNFVMSSSSERNVGEIDVFDRRPYLTESPGLKMGLKKKGMINTPPD